jgi:NADP-reducing hydrogenase subunit HndA
MEISQKGKKTLNRILKKHISDNGNVISLLQHIQGIFGYIPEEVVSWFSEKLDIQESHFYGVITFYSQFYLHPRGKYNIQVCLGTACFTKRAGGIMNRIHDHLNIKVDETTGDKKFSLEAVRCLGACGLAPVMVVGTDIYGAVKLRNVKRIIDNY